MFFLKKNKLSGSDPELVVKIQDDQRWEQRSLTLSQRTSLITVLLSSQMYGTGRYLLHQVACVASKAAAQHSPARSR
jgi:hypothetical protein